MKKVALIILTQLLKIWIVLTSLVTIATFVLGAQLFFSIKPVTNVARYGKIKPRWPAELVSHFPAKASRDSAFYFRPGVLQGGSLMQLQEKLTQAEAEAAIQRFSKGAIEIRKGGGERKTDIPTPILLAGKSDYEEFPADFIIITIKAEPTSEHPPKWNHGKTAGVAVNARSGVIVYWAEEW